MSVRIITVLCAAADAALEQIWFAHPALTRRAHTIAPFGLFLSALHRVGKLQCLYVRRGFLLISQHRSASQTGMLRARRVNGGQTSHSRARLARATFTRVPRPTFGWLGGDFLRFGTMCVAADAAHTFNSRVLDTSYRVLSHVWLRLRCVEQNRDCSTVPISNS